MPCSKSIALGCISPLPIRLDAFFLIGRGQLFSLQIYPSGICLTSSPCPRPFRRVPSHSRQSACRLPLFRQRHPSPSLPSPVHARRRFDCIVSTTSCRSRCSFRIGLHSLPVALVTNTLGRLGAKIDKVTAEEKVILGRYRQSISHESSRVDR